MKSCGIIISPRWLRENKVTLTLHFCLHGAQYVMLVRVYENPKSFCITLISGCVGKSATINSIYIVLRVIYSAVGEHFVENKFCTQRK